MFNKLTTLASSLILASLASAENDVDSNAQKYPRWASIMDQYGFTWDSVEVTTDDGYILALFHITGQVGQEPFVPSKPPVLMQHGDFEDGAEWVGYADPDDSGELPMQLKLALEGYDVFIGNNRGTPYSQTHVKYDAVKDAAEYWNFSWAEMGLYDGPANILSVKAQTGADKIFYVGYSQGTVQMHYGLAHIEDSFYAKHLYRAVHLAPCFIAEIIQWQPEFLTKDMFTFPSVGVYAINGPNWTEDNKTICDNYDYLTCKEISHTTGWMPVSVKANNHWGFNAYQKRFQEYADDYLEGQKTAPLVPIDTIDKVPLSFLVGGKDHVCPIDQAEAGRATIGDDVTFWHEFPKFSHTHFAGARDDEFMSVLISQLQVPQSEERAQTFLQ